MKKITLEIEDDIYNDIVRLVPWGSRRRVFEGVLRLIRDAALEDGTIVVGAIMANQFKIIWKDNQVAEVRGPKD